LNQNKTKTSPKRRKKKILLIDDSHMRGCASELGKQLGPEYEITGTVMSGWRLQNITELAKNELGGLSNGDAVIIWGGPNDINCSETRKGLKYLNDFVKPRSNTNILRVTAPHRGRDSVVGIVTCYGLEGPGIESRWGRHFSHLSRPALGPSQLPVHWVPGLSRG
jgi:hypothetical protein